MNPVAAFHVGTFPYRRLVSRLISVPAERWELNETEGCITGKILGTGRGSSTRIGFDPTRWAMFTAWEDEGARDSFCSTSTVLQRWESTAKSLDTYFLWPLSARGTWNGTEPFAELDTSEGAFVASENYPPTHPHAVLTRATLRWSRLLRFMRSVPRVDDALQNQPGCSLAMGIGEWPIGQQATFSLWESAQAIDRFAHEGAAHSEVVKRTYKEGWYSEELFCRFLVTEQKHR